MANQTRWPVRLFAVTFVVLFAAGIVAVPIIYFTQDKQSKAASTTTATSNASGSTSKVDNQKQLQGKPLANFTPITSPVTSLQAIDMKEGTGATVKPGDTVTVDYTGAIASTGVVFQSSLDSGQPISFGLNQVIKGWTDGVPGMKVGGTRRLIIPAAQAYGAQSTGGIPANSDLVFDITLHAIGK